MVAPAATCCAREWCGGVISIWQREVDESQMPDGVTPGALACHGDGYAAIVIMALQSRSLHCFIDRLFLGVIVVAHET